MYKKYLHLSLRLWAIAVICEYAKCFQQQQQSRYPNILYYWQEINKSAVTPGGI